MDKERTANDLIKVGPLRMSEKVWREANEVAVELGIPVCEFIEAATRLSTDRIKQSSKNTQTHAYAKPAL